MGAFITRRLLLTAGIVFLISLVAVGTAIAQTNRPQVFLAHLSGEQEAEPVDTRARGLAHFHLNHDGDELRYTLIVANIEDVFASHIHLEASNGPVVVWLYPPDGPPGDQIDGRFSGVLAKGTITADDLVGPLEKGSLDDLLDEMRSGNAFVNVHTEANPGGEIAGPVKFLNSRAAR